MRRSYARLVQLAIFAAAFTLGLGVSAAWAGSYTHSYRQGDHNAIDGVRAVIRGDAFYAPSDACVIYAIVMHDQEGNQHQLEAGLVRCGSSVPAGGIDGTCPDGYSFAERWTGTSFFCNPGDNFDNDLDYTAFIRRGSASDIVPTAYVYGAQISQTGFNTDNVTKALAWGEVTSGTASTTCPTGNAAGEFKGWKKLLYSGGSGTWSVISASSTGWDQTGVSGAPCWTIGSVDGTGDFSVS